MLLSTLLARILPPARTTRPCQLHRSRSRLHPCLLDAYEPAPRRGCTGPFHCSPSMASTPLCHSRAPSRFARHCTADHWARTHAVASLRVQAGWPPPSRPTILHCLASLPALTPFCLPQAAVTPCADRQQIFCNSDQMPTPKLARVQLRAPRQGCGMTLGAERSVGAPLAWALALHHWKRTCAGVGWHGQNEWRSCHILVHISSLDRMLLDRTLKNMYKHQEDV